MPDKLVAILFYSSMRHSVKSFKVFKKCFTELDTKIQETLLIKQLNPKLNKQLYAKGASFLLAFFIYTLVCIIFSSCFKFACFADFCFSFLDFLTFN